MTPNITEAIQAHQANPKIPVTRICKVHNVSRATFYRHLGKLFPKANPPPKPKVISETSKHAENALTAEQDITSRNTTDDLFFEAKFDEHGNVRDGWNYQTWLNHWWANATKTSTKNCHTATRPHRPKRQ